MGDYKEFQGKSLDEAIREACEYFGAAREKLEIDIVSDAKSGIFGLVGAKKAIIRAGRVNLPGAVDALLADNQPVDCPLADSPLADVPSVANPLPPLPPLPKKGKKKAGKGAEDNGDCRGTGKCAGAVANTSLSGDCRGAKRQESARWGDDCRDGNASREDMPDVDLASCDQDRLFAVVKEVVLHLIQPIVGDVPCTVAISGARVRATLDCGDAAGLLVGRDGQTLASVQYLASRIIARRIGGAVRLQIDAGNYRERQDDELKALAQSLALRVKETGRAMSTRPLTAYQRRIVHLTLEHDEAVQTYSKGEGAQRKVMIAPQSSQARQAHQAPMDAGRGNGQGAGDGEAVEPGGAIAARPEKSARPRSSRPAKKDSAGRGGQKRRAPRSDSGHASAGRSGSGRKPLPASADTPAPGTADDMNT